MLKTQNFVNFMLSLSLILTLFLAPPWSSPSHVNVLLYVHRHVIVGQMIPWIDILIILFQSPNSKCLKRERFHRYKDCIIQKQLNVLFNVTLKYHKPSYSWELLSKADALGCFPDFCISVTQFLGAFKFQKNKLCTKFICSNTYGASDALFACLCDGWGRKQAHMSSGEGLSRVKTTIPYTMHIVFSSNLYGIDIFGGKGDVFWDFLIRFLQSGHSLREISAIV